MDFSLSKREIALANVLLGLFQNFHKTTRVDLQKDSWGKALALRIVVSINNLPMIVNSFGYKDISTMTGGCFECPESSLPWRQARVQGQKLPKELGIKQIRCQVNTPEMNRETERYFSKRAGVIKEPEVLVYLETLHFSIDNCLILITIC